jgi:SET domain-containing protein
MENDKFPHSDVYVRLGCSDLHGVGVFAIKEIPEGIDIFCGDKCDVAIVPKAIVDNQEEEIKKLYDDFCALQDGKYYCPDSFNNMNVSYFLNQSEEPNITTDDGHCFYTKRKIMKGEELTVDYSTFSEEPGRY